MPASQRRPTFLELPVEIKQPLVSWATYCLVLSTPSAWVNVHSPITSPEGWSSLRKKILRHAKLSRNMEMSFHLTVEPSAGRISKKQSNRIMHAILSTNHWWKLVFELNSDENYHTWILSWLHKFASGPHGASLHGVRHFELSFPTGRITPQLTFEDNVIPRAFPGLETFIINTLGPIDDGSNFLRRQVTPLILLLDVVDFLCVPRVVSDIPARRSRLTKLKLKDHGLWDTALQLSMIRLPTLTWLELECQETVPLIAQFVQDSNCQLRHLTLRNVKLSDEAIGALLSTLPDIESLELVVRYNFNGSLFQRLMKSPEIAPNLQRLVVLALSRLKLGNEGALSEFHDFAARRKLKFVFSANSFVSK
ncbi:hypothetical protein CC1G_09960 [Coprinopsis cinerea okayama7|uniref:F-box domain-containing protein n=1 Tax=Coprinopsis cinerea (strain Okayama-7 / 130 / ATCC MYA-4618 / FGSC 9003) TaxID=240176 RepID=A8PGS3_COPC7|nr:hypothetical protein CC1G_09960 [Coprinopsis cinerea okayama7\|eukprot:XP_001841268.2 hypothetical protein CC1G_09960 [Coprinopsis cinerea okayama7\